MEQIIFSPHSEKQIVERGTSKKEIIETVTQGETLPAKHSRIAYRKNFQYDRKWGEKFYHIKQVMSIVKKEHNKLIVVTVYTFYF